MKRLNRLTQRILFVNNSKLLLIFYTERKDTEIPMKGFGLKLLVRRCAEDEFKAISRTNEMFQNLQHAQCVQMIVNYSDISRMRTLPTKRCHNRHLRTKMLCINSFMLCIKSYLSFISTPFFYIFLQSSLSLNFLFQKLVLDELKKKYNNCGTRFCSQLNAQPSAPISTPCENRKFFPQLGMTGLFKLVYRSGHCLTFSYLLTFNCSASCSIRSPSRSFHSCDVNINSEYSIDRKLRVGFSEKLAFIMREKEKKKRIDLNMDQVDQQDVSNVTKSRSNKAAEDVFLEKLVTEQLNKYQVTGDFSDFTLSSMDLSSILDKGFNTCVKAPRAGYASFFSQRPFCNMFNTRAGSRDYVQLRRSSEVCRTLRCIRKHALCDGFVAVKIVPWAPYFFGKYNHRDLLRGLPTPKNEFNLELSKMYLQHSNGEHSTAMGTKGKNSYHLSHPYAYINPYFPNPYFHSSSIKCELPFIDYGGNQVFVSSNLSDTLSDIYFVSVELFHGDTIKEIISSDCSQNRAQEIVATNSVFGNELKNSSTTVFAQNVREVACEYDGEHSLNRIKSFASVSACGKGKLSTQVYHDYSTIYCSPNKRFFFSFTTAQKGPLGLLREILKAVSATYNIADDCKIGSLVTTTEDSLSSYTFEQEMQRRLENHPHIFIPKVLAWLLSTSYVGLCPQYSNCMELPSTLTTCLEPSVLFNGSESTAPRNSLYSLKLYLKLFDAVDSHSNSEYNFCTNPLSPCLQCPVGSAVGVNRRGCMEFAAAEFIRKNFYREIRDMKCSSSNDSRVHSAISLSHSGDAGFLYRYFSALQQNPVIARLNMEVNDKIAQKERNIYMAQLEREFGNSYGWYSPSYDALEGPLLKPKNLKGRARNLNSTIASQSQLTEKITATKIQDEETSDCHMIISSVCQKDKTEFINGEKHKKEWGSSVTLIPRLSFLGFCRNLAREQLKIHLDCINELFAEFSSTSCSVDELKRKQFIESLSSTYGVPCTIVEIWKHGVWGCPEESTDHGAYNFEELFTTVNDGGVICSVTLSAGSMNIVICTTKRAAPSSALATVSAYASLFNTGISSAADGQARKENVFATDPGCLKQWEGVLKAVTEDHLNFADPDKTLKRFVDLIFNSEVHFRENIVSDLTEGANGDNKEKKEVFTVQCLALKKQIYSDNDKNREQLLSSSPKYFFPLINNSQISYRQKLITAARFCSVVKAIEIILESLFSISEENDGCLSSGVRTLHFLYIPKDINIKTQHKQDKSDLIESKVKISQPCKFVKGLGGALDLVTHRATSVAAELDYETRELTRVFGADVNSSSSCFNSSSTSSVDKSCRDINGFPALEGIVIAVRLYASAFDEEISIADRLVTQLTGKRKLLSNASSVLSTLVLLRRAADAVSTACLRLEDDDPRIVSLSCLSFLNSISDFSSFLGDGMIIKRVSCEFFSSSILNDSSAPQKTLNSVKDRVLIKSLVSFSLIDSEIRAADSLGGSLLESLGSKIIANYANICVESLREWEKGVLIPLRARTGKPLISKKIEELKLLCGSVSELYKPFEQISYKLRAKRPCVGILQILAWIICETLGISSSALHIFVLNSTVFSSLASQSLPYFDCTAVKNSHTRSGSINTDTSSLTVNSWIAENDTCSSSQVDSNRTESNFMLSTFNLNKEEIPLLEWVGIVGIVFPRHGMVLKTSGMSCNEIPLLLLQSFDENKLHYFPLQESTFEISDSEVFIPLGIGTSSIKKHAKDYAVVNAIRVHFPFYSNFLKKCY